MKGKLEEIYTEDGKDITEIIQEWVLENNKYFCCKKEGTDIKSMKNR